MHFCSKCDNMYYIKISDEEVVNTLIYYCRNCGNEDSVVTSENIVVSKTQLSRTEQKYGNVVNKYTKLDPTLPRINTIKCPNPTCKSNVKQNENEREVIYMRYDDINMKYVYICAVCDTVWKTDES
jgi:DNA-directed RNA polymerase subunit M/transcription elongation factor TFIIS